MYGLRLRICRVAYHIKTPENKSTILSNNENKIASEPDMIVAIAFANNSN